MKLSYLKRFEIKLVKKQRLISVPEAHHPILNFGNPFPSGPILTIPKDSKLLFEPEINVKIEQPSPAPSGALVQNLNHSHNQSKELRQFNIYKMQSNPNLEF